LAKWVIDPDHSVAVFSIRHFEIANVHGHFNKITGTIHFDPADVAHSSVEVTIDAASICTGIKKRDDHLRSPDFFDIEKYPKILFKNTEIKISDSNQCKVNGELTIREVTKPIILKVEYFGPIKSPFGATSLGFSAKTRINREDFGITWNMAMEGGVAVGRDVEITLDVEADLVAE
jgi:polyisoprenoid-binding protein YceI